ncbi:hypothetical protein F5148DRAFT_872399 [Russula earlei]|uniref:Uncharacterized protein n=1 Tax=Russula earlei TaxID=71964 RepID=A0ACC0UCR9_9AGAM|nr:hypothetical protein F5148DRAFT_872399 [Russula earlei]
MKPARITVVRTRMTMPSAKVPRPLFIRRVSAAADRVLPLKWITSRRRAAESADTTQDVGRRCVMTKSLRFTHLAVPIEGITCPQPGKPRSDAEFFQREGDAQMASRLSLALGYWETACVYHCVSSQIFICCYSCKVWSQVQLGSLDWNLAMHTQQIVSAGTEGLHVARQEAKDTTLASVSVGRAWAENIDAYITITFGVPTSELHPSQHVCEKIRGNEPE